MAPEILAGLIMGFLFLMILIGMHVGLAMILAGTVGIALIIPVDAALHLLGQTVLETMLSFELSIIPLFVLMGYFTATSGLSRDLYNAFNAWLGHMRGGLAMATIAACGAFGAISGSSVATAATMTEVALPEMRRFGYAPSFSTGVIAAGGTIGILIPPSVIMVLYGVMTETSIVDMFVAGVIPGLLMVLLFLATAFLVATVRPAAAPRGEKLPLADRIKASRSVFGTSLLFVIVIGGLYLGIFTPTEAGGIGAFGAWVIALAMGRMSRASFLQALLDTVRTTVMIFTILTADRTAGYGSTGNRQETKHNLHLFSHYASYIETKTSKVPLPSSTFHLWP
jgi:tripartite ATP-independent transporter DctM subunit